ncbi:hypothetical protein LN042_08740 [Kitasatospora sp. RB6PN24]|uniref:hypothetical protein n=1 Tax=Kitasatospora humi TaxID=2893891 RepID=UPI001E4A913F|nr:hypothetical protein [Kitasatospora humi]MCC9307186.1 hypothetical protein [Kitasatospora humi]
MPSPLPSAPQAAQVEGMNCIGPTAWSHTVLPPYLPPSVFGMAALPPVPSSSGPRIGV